ncbi:MAG TPA: type III pantothenate kinase [Pseudidiomarina sp.]|nr:type III pantothenate kinase [Pseudidiomarina sp.]
MMKQLLVDAGNTRVKTALMDADGHLEPLFNVAYSELKDTGFPADIQQVWMGAVSNQERMSLLNDWLSQTSAKTSEIHSEKTAFGVTSAYEQPASLGIDRWLAMIGAYSEQQRPTLIIDAGTAITADWLTGEGTHLGGWIVPGVDLMQSAVIERAPKVFRHHESSWGKVNQLGLSTPDGLSNGCTNAMVGFIRQAIAVTETELDWFDYRIIFSGGSTPLIPIELRRRGEMRTELVLYGLARYAERK